MCTCGGGAVRGRGRSGRRRRRARAAGSRRTLPPTTQAGPDGGQAGRGFATRRDGDDRLVRLGPPHHLELGGAGPQDREGTRGGGGRAGDGALGDVLEPVGAVTPESHGAAAVHRDADPTAPAQPGCIAGNRFHLGGPFQSGQALQLLGNPEGLQASLRPDVHVLEVTAATAARRPGVQARGLRAVGGAGRDLDGIGPQVGGGAGGHPGPGPARRGGCAGQRPPCRRGPEPRPPPGP